MDIFRYSRNAYGQQTLQGISWDLLWVFVGLAALIICGHMLYKWLRKEDKRESA